MQSVYSTTPADWAQIQKEEYLEIMEDEGGSFRRSFVKWAVWNGHYRKVRMLTKETRPFGWYPSFENFLQLLSFKVVLSYEMWVDLAVRVFANGPGDLGSIPGRVIPKTQKMVLDASLLNTQHYKVRIKGKVEQSREGVAPSPTHWCSSYRKGSLRVTLN